MPKGIYKRKAEHGRKTSRGLKKYWKNNKADRDRVSRQKKGKTYEEMYGDKADEMRLKCGGSNKGRKYRPMSKKGRENISHAQTKEVCEKGWETRRKRFGKSGGNVGNGGSPETLKKIAIANTGKIISKKTRLRISIGRTGKGLGPRPEKFKRRMSKERIELISSGKIKITGAGKNGHYESKHNGRVRYRSSYELATMKYFDNNNIKWIYEGKQNVFYLKSIGKSYLNDFYLPDEDKYIQVKGYMPSDDKYYAFIKDFPELHIELWDGKVLKGMGILK